MGGRLAGSGRGGGGIALGLLLVGLGAATPAGAVGVTISAATLFANLVPAPVAGTWTVPGDLVMENGGSILCNDDGAPGNDACPIKILVHGNMVMKAGSAIFAENRVNGGNGGDIEITVRAT